MAVYRCISINFWSDRKVLKKFSPEDKYFFLYLLTNEATTISGCYELNIEDASIDLGYNIETIENLINRMVTYHKVIRTNKIDDEHYEVLILNWKKYNWTKSKKMIQAVKYSIGNIKTKEFREYISNELAALEDNASHVQEVAKAQSKLRVHQSTNSNPTFEEVERYCIENGYEMDYGKFWFYYEHYDWKDSNGNPINDWKKYLDVCERSGNFRKTV